MGPVDPNHQARDGDCTLLVMSENSIHTGLACVLPLHLIIAALFGWLERPRWTPKTGN